MIFFLSQLSVPSCCGSPRMGNIHGMPNIGLGFCQCSIEKKSDSQGWGRGWGRKMRKHKTTAVQDRKPKQSGGFVSVLVSRFCQIPGEYPGLIRFVTNDRESKNYQRRQSSRRGVRKHYTFRYIKRN